MTITHFLMEFNGTSAFTFKAQQRDGGGSVLDSYTFGDISPSSAMSILKALEVSGALGSSQLKIKISSTEFNFS